MTVSEIINDQTPIAVGTAIAIVLGVASVAWWMIRGISDIRSRLDRQDSKFEQLITAKRFYEWVYHLQRMNPDLKLPEEFP